MKKRILLSGLLLMSTITSAQLLTRNDIGYQTGESYTMFLSLYLDPGADSIGSTWDLSSPTVIEEIEITINDQTAAFPIANTRHTFANSVHTYLNITNSSIDIVGTDFVGDVEHFSDHQTLIHFPVSNLSDFTDTYHATSNQGERSGTTWESFSGKGTLITPEGTYTDVFRLKQTDISIQSFTDFPDIYDTTVTYFWYKAGIHHELAAVTTSRSSAGNSENAYYTSTEPTLNTIENQLSDITISPNPASETVQISGTEKIDHLEMYDLSGDLVLEKAVSGVTALELNMNDLSPGIYLLHFFDESGNNSVKRISKN